MTTTHRAKQCRLCLATSRNRCRYGDPLGNNPPGDPRLPFAPLEAIAAARAHRPVDPFGTRYDRGPSLHDLAHIIGAGAASQITRWREVGIGIHDADRAAVHLGYAPHQIWGWDTWLNIGFAHCPHADGVEVAA